MDAILETGLMLKEGLRGACTLQVLLEEKQRALALFTNIFECVMDSWRLSGRRIANKCNDKLD